MSKTSTFDSLNSKYIEIYGFIRIDLCVILGNLFSIPQIKMSLLICQLFIKKNYYDRYYEIITNSSKKTNKNEKPAFISWSVYSELLARLTPVHVCLSSPFVLLSVITP